jgi:hypothetical protein
LRREKATKGVATQPEFAASLRAQDLDITIRTQESRSITGTGAVFPSEQVIGEGMIELPTALVAGRWRVA